MNWPDGPGVVEFPDGRRIRGRGLRRPFPAGPHPDYGVYLLARDPGPFDWEHRWVRWGDFRTPTSTDDALDALAEGISAVAIGAGRDRVRRRCGPNRDRLGGDRRARGCPAHGGGRLGAQPIPQARGRNAVATSMGP